MLSQRRQIHERQRPCESLARSQTLRGRDPNWEGCPIEAGNPRLKTRDSGLAAESMKAGRRAATSLTSGLEFYPE